MGSVFSRNVKSVSRRRKLAVESLEDRCVPALSFTSLMDSALGSTTYGNTVTLSAIVTNSVGNPISEGTVAFYANGNLLASSSVNNSGITGYVSKATAAGTVFLTAIYSDPSFNYSSSTSNTDTLTIKPAPLTITADNQSTVYGEAIPPLGLFTCYGLVNGDTPASLTTQPMSTTTTLTRGESVGVYPIYISGAVDPNYTITYIDGTFTITPDSTANGHSDCHDIRNLDINFFVRPASQNRSWPKCR